MIDNICFASDILLQPQLDKKYVNEGRQCIDSVSMGSSPSVMAYLATPALRAACSSMAQFEDWLFHISTLSSLQYLLSLHLPLIFGQSWDFVWLDRLDPLPEHWDSQKGKTN